MSLPSLRRRFGPALVVVLALVVPSATGVAGAGPRQAADAAATADDDVVEQPFFDLPGVDLVALGYAGVELDAGDVERISADLPEDDRERIAELATRLELAPPVLEALVEAEEVLERALAGLDPAVTALRTNLAVAEHVRDETRRRADDTRDRLEQRLDELAAHRRQMAEVAVAAYVNPPDADVIASVLGGAATTNEDLTAGVLFTAKADHDGIVRDDLELATAIAGERAARAELDAEAAVQRAGTAASTLAEVEARRDAHRAAHELVAAAAAVVDEAIPVLQEDLDETIERAWGDLDHLAHGEGADVSIVNVDGIRVHVAIAARLQALLIAAHADGVPLGGWGHRSTEQQIMLRRAHCGPTPEDIYLKPASECSPPTARPGASMHERGLAIDFHLAGRGISTRDSPGYQWLAANAAFYGFYNLPSEPWHWSVNGQ